MQYNSHWPDLKTTYIEELESALFNKSLDNFSDIVSQHAAHIIKLSEAICANDSAKLILASNKLYKVNNKWVTKICPIAKKDGDFRHTTKCLVKGYSKMLVGYMLTDNIKSDKLKNLIKLEAKFYKGISRDDADTEKLKEMWVSYTHSLIGMHQELKTHGKSENFFTLGRQCIVVGQILGRTLDNLLY